MARGSMRLHEASDAKRQRARLRALRACNARNGNGIVNWIAQRCSQSYEKVATPTLLSRLDARFLSRPDWTFAAQP